MNAATLTPASVARLSDEEGLTFLGIFGSVSRGEERPDSDLDVLIDYRGAKSLFDLARIKLRIEEAAGRPVDLVTRRALKPALREAVERDLIVLRAQG